MNVRGQDDQTRLLVIDDDLAVRSSLQLLFKQVGYSVVTAHSAIEGLRKIPSAMPDVIVLDLNMAGMNGLTFLRQIATPDGKTKVPTIVFTAYSDMSDDPTATQLAAAVLRKPIDLERLPAEIARILGTAAQG